MCFDVILQKHLDLLVHFRPNIFDKEARNYADASEAHQCQRDGPNNVLARTAQANFYL